MHATKLLFLDDFTLTTCEANVLDVHHEDQQVFILLNQTVFYPQGGGQPYDQGTITNVSGNFEVLEVRKIDDIVRHIGKFPNGNFNAGDKVSCHVDEERRSLHNRLHSAGHVVDMAVQELKLPWVPYKGHHFPTSPNVEYNGSLEDLDKEQLKTNIEHLCNAYLKDNITPTIRFVEKQTLQEFCHYVPDYLPADKLVRLIMFNDFAVPCGGTHVNHLAEIKNIIIRKIKMEAGKIRVSYAIAD